MSWPAGPRSAHRTTVPWWALGHRCSSRKAAKSSVDFNTNDFVKELETHGCAHGSRAWTPRFQRTLPRHAYIGSNTIASLPTLR